jgi:hypothetical protein
VHGEVLVFSFLKSSYCSSGCSCAGMLKDLRAVRPER